VKRSLQINALLARAISTLLLPPFVLFASYSFVLAHCARFHENVRLLLCVAFSLIVLFPILFFVLLMKLRKISDQDAMNRRERTNPYLFGIVLMSLGIILSIVLHLPGVLIAPWLSFLLSLIAVLIINFKWKISAHLMSFAIAVCNVCLVAGQSWGLLFLLAPFLGWSRFYLKSHTVLQVAAGFFLGIVLSLFSFGLLARN
jgi:membrane-associated phospholipid phosphatase